MAVQVYLIQDSALNSAVVQQAITDGEVWIGGWNGYNLSYNGETLLVPTETFSGALKTWLESANRANAWPQRSGSQREQDRRDFEQWLRDACASLPVSIPGHVQALLSEYATHGGT